MVIYTLNPIIHAYGLYIMENMIFKYGKCTGPHVTILPRFITLTKRGRGGVIKGQSKPPRWTPIIMFCAPLSTPHHSPA